ncbi:MAG: hybrid sensor histidine kinase/response regulator [Deltaproteobacteria bacterium]|nr:hybrid sensor histidine kinase/response regulator [Deltaproteobacteria bacterium]
MPSRILYIGAENEHHALARRLLREDGHDFLTETSARGATDRALEMSPDLILVDLEDCGEDPEPLASRIRSSPGLMQVPVIALGRHEVRERMLSLGCDGVIEPPLNPTTFARTIGQYLRGHRERVRPAVRSRELEAFSRELVDRLEAKVAELTAANVRLRRADEVKVRVLENVSRELAAPLTPMVANLSRLLSGQLGPMVPRQRRVLGAVDRDLARLATTVSRVLDIASFTDFRPTEDPAPVDLNEVCRAAVRTLESKARSRRVSLDLHLPAKPVRARIDGKLLRQAVVNAVDHAVAFVPRGGFVLVAVEPQAVGTQVRIYDSGRPLDPGERASLFDPFSGAGRRDGDGHPALSLGLALAHKIATALELEVWAESPPEHHPGDGHEYPGVCIAFSLPPTLTEGLSAR